MLFRSKSFARGSLLVAKVKPDFALKTLSFFIYLLSNRIERDNQPVPPLLWIGLLRASLRAELVEELKPCPGIGFGSLGSFTFLY